MVKINSECEQCIHTKICGFRKEYECVQIALKSMDKFNVGDESRVKEITFKSTDVEVIVNCPYYNENKPTNVYREVEENADSHPRNYIPMSSACG